VNASSATSDVSGDSGVTRAYHTAAAAVAVVVLVGKAAGRVRLGIVEGAASSSRPAGIGDAGPWRWLEVAKMVVAMGRGLGRERCRLSFWGRSMIDLVGREVRRRGRSCSVVYNLAARTLWKCACRWLSQCCLCCAVCGGNRSSYVWIWYLEVVRVVVIDISSTRQANSWVSANLLRDVVVSARLV
jgi:hypothetical protein